MKKQNRIETEYYQNGNKSSETPYVNGKIHGLQIYWYENGNKSSKTLYFNGIIVDNIKIWHEDGSFFAKVPHVKNQVHGFFSYFSVNNQFLYYRKYKKGFLNGSQLSVQLF